MLAVVSEPDLAVLVDIKIIGTIEIVAVVVVKQSTRLSRGCVESVNAGMVAAAVDVIVTTEGGKVDETIAVAATNGTVDGRTCRLFEQYRRVFVQVDNQLREKAVLQTSKVQLVRLGRPDGSFVGHQALGSEDEIDRRSRAKNMLRAMLVPDDEISILHVTEAGLMGHADGTEGVGVGYIVCDRTFPVAADDGAAIPETNNGREGVAIAACRDKRAFLADKRSLLAGGYGGSRDEQGDGERSSRRRHDEDCEGARARAWRRR